jgi:hypothetical protein
MNYKVVFEIDKRDGLAKQVNKSNCCDATFTFVDAELCCKKCFEKIVWSD